MCRGLLGIMIALLVTACAANKPETLETQVQSNLWANLGGKLNSGPIEVIMDSQIATYQGNPFIALTGCSSLPCLSTDVYVKRWNSLLNTWTQLGAGLDVFMGEPASLAAFAIDAKGSPIVAFNQCYVSEALECESWGVVIKRWNSQAWVTLPELPVGRSFEPAHVQLASAESSFYALYSVNPSDGASFGVYRLDGENWMPIGSFPTTVFGLVGVHLVVNSLGQPIVSWNEFDDKAGFSTYISQYEGNTWRTITGLFPSYLIYTLHVDSSNNLIGTIGDNIVPENTVNLWVYRLGIDWDYSIADWLELLGGNLWPIIGIVQSLDNNDNPMMYGSSGLQYWNGSSWIAVPLAVPTPTNPGNSILEQSVFVDRNVLLLTTSECTLGSCQFNRDTYLSVISRWPLTQM